MKRFAYLSGKILPLEDASVSISDIGLMRGFALYEAITLINGKPFRLSDHWRRLEKGARTLGLRVPVSVSEAERIIRELAEKSELKGRANVRVILTGGKTVGGIDFDPQNPTFYILVEEWVKLPEENYTNGAKLIVHEFLRDMPEVKTTNYTRAVSLQEEKKKEDALEILYTHEGKVLECATSNFFLVKDNVLITPDKDILEGVTRKIVLELSKDDYKIEERVVAVEELKSADEIFITASFKDIVPIVKVDNFGVKDGSVGKISKDLMGKFAKYLS